MTALEVLKIMRDTGEELVHEKSVAYLGNRRVSAGVVHELNRAMALRLDSQSHIGGFERYTINDTGRKLLEDR